jgi:restriction system protein
MSFQSTPRTSSIETNFEHLLRRVQAISSVLFPFFFYAGLILFAILGIAKTIAVLASIGLLWGGIFLGTESLRKRASLSRPCPHGIKGGVRGSCEDCALIARVSQLEMQARSEQLERKEAIRESAMALRAREIRRLSAAWITQADSYFAMTPRQFEDSIAELFRRLGYAVEQTPFSSDGGKDAIALKDGKKFLIECKRFGDHSTVGRRDIQILHSAMVDSKAEQGFYVTTGSFAQTAIEYAKKNNIKIYDRTAVPRLVAQAYGQSQDSSIAEVICYDCGARIRLPLSEATASGRCENGHEVLMNITLKDLGVVHLSEQDAPTCPRCGSPMRKISRFGRAFWGCSKFPTCRGTRPAHRG